MLIIIGDRHSNF